VFGALVHWERELVAGRRLDETLLVWLALMLAAGFWLPKVDHAAHLGGLVAGLALGATGGWLGRRRLRRRILAVLAAGLLSGCTIPMVWAMWPVADLQMRARRTWARGRGPGDLATADGGPERTTYTRPEYGSRWWSSGCRSRFRPVRHGRAGSCSAMPGRACCLAALARPTSRRRVVVAAGAVAGHRG